VGLKPLIRFALQKGEGLGFNNQRVLHDHFAFNANQPGRLGGMF